MKGFRGRTLLAMGLVALAFWACPPPDGDSTSEVPGVPENLAAQATSDGLGLILSWSAGAGPVEPESFIVYFNNDPIATLPASQTTYTVNDAGIGTYAVSAWTNGNESDKAEVSTIPVETTNLDVYELNSPNGPSGLYVGSDFKAQTISVCDANAPSTMDLYFTDDAAGADVSVVVYFKGAARLPSDGGKNEVDGQCPSPLPDTGWKTAYVDRVQGTFSGIADPGTNEETPAFSGAAEFVFKVNVGGNWHYGYFVTSAPDTANEKVTITSLKVQPIPGFKKIQ